MEEKIMIFIIFVYFIVLMVLYMLKNTIDDKDRSLFQIWCCVVQIINLILFIFAYWWCE